MENLETHSKSWFGSVLFLAMVLFSGAVAASAQTSIFNGPRDYVVGAYPESVVVADFNGDGRPDVATANQVSNNISVLLQNRDGTFQPAVNYAVGNGPISLQAGDFNNDGILDLLVLNATDSTVGVLFGNGNGTFQTEKVTAIPGSPLPFVAVGDFNGDSKLDVAIVVPLPAVGTFGAAVMVGNGDGTFQPPSTTFSLVGQPVGLTAVDINKDGKSDLVAVGSGSANLTGAVSVLLGRGDGTFQTAVTTSYSISSGPISGLVVADFNQDGHLDVATGSEDGLTVFLGNGDGTFGAPIISAGGGPIAAGDLNGDGKLDLISGGVLLGNGDGTFDVGQPIPGGAALSDLNGDGKLDLVTAHLGTHGGGVTLPDIVSVLFGNGDGTFPVPPAYGDIIPQFPTKIPTFTSLVAADFNNDGKIDLDVGLDYSLSGGAPGQALYLSTGTDFAAPLVTSLPATGSKAAADFNRDGKMDLAVAVGGVAIFLGNGDGTFQNEITYGSGMTGPIAVGDFNNDGKLDVLGFSPQQLSVLLGNGDGTFGFPVNSPTGGAAVSGLTVAYLNNDTKLDAAVLIASSTGAVELAIFLGNGDGTFSAGSTYNVGLNPTAIASGDLNGDGIPDIVIGNSDSSSSTPSSIVVLLGNGDGTFKSPVTFVTGNGINALAVADFNNDGKQDVVMVNGGWSDLALLLGNGDGTFQTPILFYLNNPLSSGLVVADFDGDRKPDVAVAGLTSVSMLLSGGLPGVRALLSTASINFGSEKAGYTSAAQLVTLSNSGSSSLNISNVALTGPQSGDFQVQNGCGGNLGNVCAPCSGTLYPGAVCAFYITFTPQAGGTRTATLQVTDSAPNSPQMVSLSGTGQDFSVTASSPSQTVSPGQTATYNVSVGPEGGFNQTVTMTCTGAPSLSSCSVSPKSFTLNGTTAQAVTVTVTTMGPSSSVTLPRIAPPTGGIYRWVTWSFASLGLITLLTLVSRRRDGWRQWRYGLTTLCLLCLGTTLLGCGGSSSGGGGGGGGGGIQPGNYNLTVTGQFTSGSLMLSHSSPLTFVVQ